MIKLVQVKRNTGSVQLLFSYTFEDVEVLKTVNAAEVVQLLRSLKLLLGRNPTLAEAKQVVVTMFNEIRRNGQVLEDVPWESMIGVNLEP
jgi:hypothetical protein